MSLRVVAHLAGLTYGGAELLRLRDAYLEPWTDGWDRPDLVEAVRLALRVGSVTRADCYRRALTDAPSTSRAAHEASVPGWLLEVHEPTPVEVSS